MILSSSTNSHAEGIIQACINCIGLGLILPVLICIKAIIVINLHPKPAGLNAVSLLQDSLGTTKSGTVRSTCHYVYLLKPKLHGSSFLAASSSIRSGSASAYTKTPTYTVICVHFHFLLHDVITIHQRYR